MTAYYNEIDPKAAAWLRELIRAGHIAAGDVDERSIEDVRPSDLHGYTQCHFFAGIGGWSLALRNAGWPDDRPVWTGSCPCQPFSSAGKGAGFDDERHLWPAFFHLIEQRRPAIAFGEQVASADGRSWLDLVFSDLEGAGYATGAANLSACGIGAPHIRQRLYWVADGDNRGEGLVGVGGPVVAIGNQDDSQPGFRRGGEDGRLADASGERRQQVARGASGDEEAHGREGRIGRVENGDNLASSHVEDRHPGATDGFWRDADWLFCRDEKWRPVEPGTFPLAHGLPARVGRVRGYGNAIVPQVAEAFIRAFAGAEPVVTDDLY